MGWTDSCPVPDGIPGFTPDADPIRNSPFYYSGFSGCGILASPSTIFRLFSSHNLASNLVHSGPKHNPLFVCYRKSSLIGTAPPLVVGRLGAPSVRPMMPADLINCTHTGPWSVTECDTTCIGCSWCILVWNVRG